MIAVDTNILIDAHRKEMPQHERARRWLTELSEGEEPWALPVFAMGEFLRVVTHPRFFKRPSSLEEALGALDGLRKSPSLRILSPGPDYPDLFAGCVRAADARGNLVFDAQIAAVCQEHEVSRILTRDRDMVRFSKLKPQSLDQPLPSEQKTGKPDGSGPS